MALLGPPEDRLDDALTLEWDAPAQCPTAEQVRRRVALAIPPGEAPSRRVHATGSVEVEAERWRLALTIETAEGTSSPGAEAADCETLVDAAVVQLSMALEVEAQEQADPEPQPQPQPPPSHENEPEAEPEPEPEPERRWDGMAGLHAGAGFGLVPTVDAWLAVSAASRFRLPSAIESAARIEVSLGHVFAQTERVTPDSDAGVQVAAWWLGPRGCWEPIVGAWSFPLCGGPDLAIVVGRGVGVDESTRASRFWLGVAGGGSVQWQPTPRLGLRLGIESFVTAVRPSFTVDRLEAVFRVRRGGIRGLFGLYVVLP